MGVEAIGFEVFAFLFVVALVAGFIDTLAGGGGLLTVPALIVSGIPPLFALGTNKLQSSVGTATATWHMLRSGRVRAKEVGWLMLAAFIASAIGSVVIQFVDTEALRFVIPIALGGIAVYFLIAPKPKEVGGKARVSQLGFGVGVVPWIGAYDGMFGPGTGSFFALAGVALRGKGMVDATVLAKTLNFATNVASLLVFLFYGKLLWLVGGVMMVGQLIGATIGSHCLLRIPASVLRWLVVVMCLAMLARYGYSEGWWGAGSLEFRECSWETGTRTQRA